MNHLFECPDVPNDLNVRALWNSPRGAADFLWSLPSLSHLPVNPPFPRPPPEPPRRRTREPLDSLQRPLFKSGLMNPGKPTNQPTTAPEGVTRGGFLFPFLPPSSPIDLNSSPPLLLSYSTFFSSPFSLTDSNELQGEQPKNV
jgi:hypothetical protein